MNSSTLISKTKDILNGDNEIDDINVAFLCAVFPYIEDIDVDSLTICNEAIPALGIKLTGFFVNTDESLINIYSVFFDEYAGDFSNLTFDKFTSIKIGMENIVSLVKDKALYKISEASSTYDLCEYIANHSEYEIILNVVTNYNVPKVVFEENKNYTISGKNIGIRTYDRGEILRKIENNEIESNTLNLVSKFGHGINAVLISSNKDVDVYLTSFNGNWLAQLYKEDSVGLLSANVRSYLKRTNRVNSQIIETVKYAPQEFVAYNNGLSSIATEISAKKINDNFYVIEELTNFLIVNGGQTTATLNECRNDRLNLNDVLVPAKLAIIKNEKTSEELISNISVFSNSQTAIKKSDPLSNAKFYKRFEELSKNIMAKKGVDEYHCFFERTNGQFNTLKRMHSKKSDPFLKLNLEKRKFTKLQLAQAIVSWEKMPYKVCGGQEKNFEFFTDTVKYVKEVDETYFKNSYALIILYRKLNALILKKKLAYKSNLIAYSMAFISYKFYGCFNFNEVWNNQDIPSNMEPLLNEIIDDVYSKLIDSPANQPDIRMWARKEECWENVKTIEKEYDYEFEEGAYDFFPQDESKIYIDNESNLKNAALWKILYRWDEDEKILSMANKDFVYKMPALIYNETSSNKKKKITKKQLEKAKAIFLSAVENGFDYKSLK